jgi:hypothetical protein
VLLELWDGFGGFGIGLIIIDLFRVGLAST